MGGPRGAARPPQARGGTGGRRPPASPSPADAGPAALQAAGGVWGDEDPPRSEGSACTTSTRTGSSPEPHAHGHQSSTPHPTLPHKGGGTRNARPASLP